MASLVGEIVQRERKPAEGAARAGQPELAGRELETRLVVPHVHGDDVVRDGQPVQLERLRPVAEQCLLERGGSGHVPVGQAYGEAVDEELRVRQRLRPGRRQRRGSRRARDVPRVLSVGEPAGVDRGQQGFEIGLPGQSGVQVLQALRGLQHERRRVAAPSQRKRDLRPHPLRPRFVQLAPRPDLSRYQQGLRGLEVSRCVLRLGRRQSP